MAEEAAERPSTIALLPIGHRLNALNIDEALQQITSRVKAWSPKQQQEVLSLLLDAVHSYPVEMAPGTVLLHAHSEAVDDPLVLIGVAQNPWPLPDEGGNARVVLSLISPRDRAPEIHLRALADLARCFHKKAVTRQVTEAESADAVEHILRQAMLASQAAEHLPDNETPATSS
jgi:mannitol/fructose-specific phosphotransferase system IIA component (Ntr-type)